MSCGPNGHRGWSSIPNPSSGSRPSISSSIFTIAKRGSMPIQSAWSNAWRTMQKLMLSDSGSGPLPVLPPIHGRFGTISCGRRLPERWITNDQRRSVERTVQLPVVGYSSPTFWQSLNSAPIHEFEKVLSGYAVIQELTATGYQPGSLPSVLVQEPWVKILRLVGSMLGLLLQPGRLRSATSAVTTCEATTDSEAIFCSTTAPSQGAR